MSIVELNPDHRRHSARFTCAFLILCINHVLVKVNRSLNLKKVDEATLLQLEGVKVYAEAAEKLSASAAKQMQISLIPEVQEGLDALASQGHNPTVNIARFWAALSGMKQLQMKGFDDFARTMLLVAPKDAELVVADDGSDPENNTLFSIAAPCMWQVTPNADDEDAAREPVLVPEQESGQESVQREMEEAFDKATRSFVKWYLEHAWASGPALTLFRESVEASSAMLTVWLEMSAERTESPHRRNLGAAVLSAVDQVDTFAKAYLVVVGDGIIDAESHSAFSIVFLAPGQVSSAKSKQSSFFRLMAAAARRNEEFKRKETQVTQRAGPELEHGALFQSRIAHMEVNKDRAYDVPYIDETMKELEKFALFSPKALAILHTSIVDSCLLGMQTVPDLADPLEQMSAFVSIQAALAKLRPADEDKARAVVEAKIQLKSKIKALRADCAVAQMKQLLDNSAQLDAAPSFLEFVPILDAISDAGLKGIDVGGAELTIVFLMQVTFERVKEEMIDPEKDHANHLSLLRQLVKNHVALTARMDPLAVVYPPAIVKSLVDKSVVIFEASLKYESTPSKANFASLTKANVAWYDIRFPKEHEGLKKLAHAALAVNFASMKAWNVKKLECVASAAGEFEKTIIELEVISGGCKESLASNYIFSLIHGFTYLGLYMDIQSVMPRSVRSRFQTLRLWLDHGALARFCMPSLCRMAGLGKNRLWKTVA